MCRERCEYFSVCGGGEPVNKLAENGGFASSETTYCRLTKMLADIQAGVEMCREHCEYFSVCGGGEPVNKLAENGSFASSETTYCRLTKMRATDLVLDALERVQRSGCSPREGALPTETAVCE